MAPVRMTELEALLTVQIAFLEEQRKSTLMVLAQVVRILLDDDEARGFEPAPFPTRWLVQMATTGRSLAQVAGSRAEAAARVREVLQPR